MILRLFSLLLWFLFLFFYIYLIKVEPILQHGIWFMWGNNFGAASTFQETNPPLSRCVPQRFSCLCCLRISEMPAIIFLREHSTCWWCDLKKNKKKKLIWYQRWLRTEFILNTLSSCCYTNHQIRFYTGNHPLWSLTRGLRKRSRCVSVHTVCAEMWKIKGGCCFRCFLIK